MNQPIINKKTYINNNTVQKKVRVHFTKTTHMANNTLHKKKNIKLSLEDKNMEKINYVTNLYSKKHFKQQKSKDTSKNNLKHKEKNIVLASNNENSNGNQCRLQKFLAAAGVGSRRACEAIIIASRVQVNGTTINQLGVKINPYKDKVTLDFQPIIKEQHVYIILNKPKGYITSVKDTKGRPTVISLINNINERIYPVGRLDFNSEGILLMTNDGDLAQKLMSPKSHIAKVYMIKVHRMPKPETLKEFRNGFRLDGLMLKPCLIEIMEHNDNPWLKVTITEGKNQQIRRMFAAVGHPVSKLKRIQFGPLFDYSLKPGMWRFCSMQEINTLKSLQE